MQVLRLLVVLLFLTLSLCHVLPLGVHKHKTKSMRVGPSTYPIQGDIDQFGEFFVNISIGSPPQTLRVQIDTGSTDLVVFADGCKKCPDAPNVTRFDATKSKTDVPIDCDDDGYTCDVNHCWQGEYCPLDLQYAGGGALGGYAATDVVAIGNISAQASFGLIKTISGSFEALGVDGNWGFAYMSLSSWGDGPVLDHMAKENKMYNSFSLCLTPENPVMDIGTNYQNSPDYEWTKVSSETYFSVEMEDISVGGQSLGISKFELNFNGVIVDSGTTLFIVSKKVMEGIQSHITSLCPTYNLPGACNSSADQTLFNGYCFPMTAEQIAMFPNISTTLKDMQPLVIPPQAYLWEGAGIQGMYCFGIQYIDQSGLPIVLGDIIMQNWHVVFDKQENMVGWGPLTSCPSVN